MVREAGISRSQLRGYLFEIIIMELLRKNGFSDINVTLESSDRVREHRPGFIEFKGRGCWHQIDCPCDYNKQIPFIYPIRLLGEVKFHKTPLNKTHIREYIGIMRDIQENYFVPDGMNIQDFYPRKLEIGVYFSANGFQREAEKLAYVHGIKTISYENNFLINRLKSLIEEFETNYISVQYLNRGAWNRFREQFIGMIRNTYYDPHMENSPYFANGYNEVVNRMRQAFVRIQTSFIATTATGVFLHFVGDSEFPFELFQGTDEGLCRIYYDYNEMEYRYFWMEISGDVHKRRFYFTPPKSLDRAAIFGNETVINEKERLFKKLSINISLNGISRNLILYLDRDWIDAILWED